MKGFMIEATETVPPEPSPCKFDKQNKDNVSCKLKTKIESRIQINGLPVSFLSAVKYCFYYLLLIKAPKRERDKKLGYFVSEEYIKLYRKQKQKEKRNQERQSKIQERSKQR